MPRIVVKGHQLSGAPVDTIDVQFCPRIGETIQLYAFPPYSGKSWHKVINVQHLPTKGYPSQGETTIFIDRGHDEQMFHDRRRMVSKAPSLQNIPKATPTPVDTDDVPALNAADVKIETYWEPPNGAFGLPVKGVIAVHYPTGCSAKSSIKRGEHANRVEALRVLAIAVHDAQKPLAAPVSVLAGPVLKDCKFPACHCIARSQCREEQ